MNLRQLDKKRFGRQGEPEDVVVGNSADSYLPDARGRKYIDFMMGWCVGNLGWGHIIRKVILYVGQRRSN